MKKSLFTLFTSLILCGLLLVWSTNAMTYTVNWNSTRIEIQKNKLNDTNTINRWVSWEEDIIFSESSSGCSLDRINSEDYILCEKSYTDWESNHTVTISNSRNIKFETVYLNNANIKSITNFDWFTRIGTLHLEWNPNIVLQNSTFQWLSTLSSLILSENNLNRDWQNTFQPSLSNLYNKETNSIQLKTNWYTTIPTEIWNSRDNYRIKLSDNVEYWDGRYEIDLSNNPINFVGITSYNQSNNTHNFERFGYFWDEGTPIYQYKIYDENDNPVIWFNTSETSASVDPSNPIDNFNPLKPGEYKFEVCLATSTICDHTNFNVDYDESITISSPQNNQEYDSLNNIPWERCRSWNYPSELLSWYSYILKKWEQEIEAASIHFYNSMYNNDYQNCEEIDIDNIISSSLQWNDPNDTYTLTVYLIDKDWYYATSNGLRIYDTTRFSINITDEPATITISNPDNVVSTQTVEFEWNWSFPNSSHTYYLDHYEYSVTWPHSYSTWGSIKNTSFQLQDLSDWAYTFTVTMYYTDNWERKSVTSTKDFSMSASESPNLSITSPINWAHITWTNATEINIPFTWKWWATLFHRYHYTIKDSSNHELTWWNITINNANHRQFSYNLWNGTYTFEVKMYNSSNVELKSDSSTFTVNIPTTLNIISPTSGNHSSATTTFSWEWFTPYSFTNYEYTVTWPNWFSLWPTTTGSTSFSLKNLRDGEYTLTITMNYKEWSTPKTITRTRNFTINASVWANIEITSPNKPTYTWNYIKTVSMNFTWNWWGSPLISRYTYEIKDRDNPHLRAAGSVDKNNAWSYSIPGTSLNLPSGKYMFEVTMLDSENRPIIEPKTYNFDVVIPSYLEILTPPEWQLSIKDVSFSRSWFAEFQDHYKYELKKINSQNNATIITWNSNTQIKNFSLQNLHNGKYTFSVEIMDDENHSIIKKGKTFRIPDDLDLVLDISDWNSSVTTLRSKEWLFNWGWKSEDFAGYSYSIQGTTFKNETYIYTWKSEWVTTWSITLSNLSTGKYRFSVNMLNGSGGIITWKYLNFTVSIPASLKISNPSNWTTITSSSTTLSRIWNWDIFRTWYSNDSWHYEYELLQVIASWYEQKAASLKTNANSFNYSSLQDWASYQLNVKLYSGSTLLASDSSTFSVSIPKKSSGGGWGGSSSKSHPTNNLSVSITNDEPTTDERVEVIVDVNDKYTGKVDFTKMQYYSFDEEKRVDIPVTSKNYVKDYSDDAKLGYVKFDSSDDWEKNLSEFLNYRIHVEDKDWYNDYVQFYIWKWSKKTQLTTTKEPEDEDEYYIARSCKKYKIEYLNNLEVYTSPNLKQDEYFVSKDYFKRYIDSKNKRADWCPTNVWWITTTYKDSSNSSDRYTAPNGKVYFINWQNWIYSSTELDKELNGAKKFSTINELKYFIRDRNPFISMAKLWPITTK